MTISTQLDLRTVEIPREFTYRGIDLTLFVRWLLEPSVRTWMNQAVLRDNPSFGVFIADLNHEGDYHAAWNDPDALAGYGYTQGPEGRRYFWNAGRKARIVARTGVDTLHLKRNPSTADSPSCESQEPDGRLLWDDFFHGGGVIVGPESGNHTLIVGVSALDAEEDHALANFIALELQYLLDQIDVALDEALVDGGDSKLVRHTWLRDQLGLAA
jgi:hypothetical protein